MGEAWGETYERNGVVLSVVDGSADAPPRPPGRARRVPAGGGDRRSHEAILLGIEHSLELVRRGLTHPLSELPNYRHLVDRIDAAIAAQARLDALLADSHLPPSGRRPHVLRFDVDRMDVLSSALGHRAAEELVLCVAERLALLVHPGDTLGQVADDDFVVACEHLDTVDAAHHYAESMLTALREPFALADGRLAAVTFSVGVAAHESDEDAERLLADAALALRQAQVAGRNRVVVFEDNRSDRGRDASLLAMATELRVALGRGEFTCHFQPMVDPRDERPFAFEALLRWDHPDRGMLAAGGFIDVAIAGGLACPIGDFVLGEACRFIAQARLALPDAIVTVNVTNEELRDPGFVLRVADALIRAEVPGEALMLELLETEQLDPDGAVAGVFDALRALGVRLAIDDFGTGYSSLSYLTKLPVQALKVDRSFVAGLCDDDAKRTVLDIVMTAARSLGLDVIVEGVETPDQAETLESLGCTKAQGWLYGRPVAADEVLAAIGAPVPAMRAPERLAQGDLGA